MEAMIEANRVEVRVNGTPVSVPGFLTRVITDAGVRHAKSRFNLLVEGAREGRIPHADAFTEIDEALAFTAECNSHMRR